MLVKILTTTSYGALAKNMDLSGQQRKQLQVSLIKAFPTKASLEQMLSFELEKNLDEIAGGTSLQEIVFNLIKIAQAQGWVEDLITAARKSNPGNEALKNIAVDLYYDYKADPKAIAISLKRLAQNNPEAGLTIVGMEVDGKNKFSLHAETTNSVNTSQLSKQYSEIYNELKKLAQEELRTLISEKDSVISKLENMVIKALERPNVYSNIEHVDFMSNNNGGISQNVSGGTVYGGIQAAQGNNNIQTQKDTTVSTGRTINMGSGNYNERIEGNYVQENYYAGGESQAIAQVAYEIQKLLQQLEKSYSTETTGGRMAIATQAIEYIDSNQTLAQRIISALKAGGTQALTQFLNHPAASFVIGALDDWYKTKGS